MQRYIIFLLCASICIIKLLCILKILQNKTVRPIHMGRTAENYCLTLKNVDAFVVAGSDLVVVELVEAP